MRDIKAAPDETVILVCRTDKRPADVVAILRDAGFRDAPVLRGAMEGWNRHRLPVEAGWRHRKDRGTP